MSQSHYLSGWVGGWWVGGWVVDKTKIMLIQLQTEVELKSELSLAIAQLSWGLSLAIKEIQ